MNTINTLPASIIVAGLIISGAILYKQGPVFPTAQPLISAEGVILPASWGNLGEQLATAGVIDEVRFRALYEMRNQFTGEYESLLLGRNNGSLKITKENANYLLNLLWALGLASKNPILEEGPMMDRKYGGPENLASVGGWTMSKGDPMNHYSRHDFFDLTSEQQNLVEKVAKGIYRPCCSNSAYFPDCNHGMAMLGLLELTASQGASEEEMNSIALAVNSYWFPEYYEKESSASRGCSV